MHRIRVFAVLLLAALLPAPASPAAAADGGEEVFHYEVQPGDTLIALTRGLLDHPRDWPAVAAANRLADPDRIHPGQIIAIPAHLLRGTPMDAVVTFRKGTVQVRETPEGPWRAVAQGDRIPPGSWLRTGEKSVVEIAYDDGTTVLQRAGTTIQVIQARRKSRSVTAKRLFVQLGRAITSIRGALDGRSRMQLESVTAVAGLRGTRLRFSVDRSEATRAEVLRGRVAVDAMDTTVLVDAGQGTLVEKGRAPLPAVRLLPAPELRDPRELYRRMPLEFAFTPVSGAASYRVVLAVDDTFRDILRDKTVPPGDTVPVIGLPDGTYVLQTTAIDARGLEGPPSDPIPIRVRVNPLPPVITGPEPDRVLRRPQMTVTWLRVTDAISYHLQVAADPSFTVPVADLTGITAVEADVPLPDYGTYHFRLCSTAADGYVGVWSDPGRVTVVPPPASPPLEPPERSDDTLRLRWQDLGDGIRYRLQLAAEPGFTRPMLDRVLDEAQLVLDLPTDPGTYYVRTSAVDAEGYEGPFGAPQSFEVPEGFDYSILGMIGAAAAALLFIF